MKRAGCHLSPLSHIKMQKPHYKDERVVFVEPYCNHLQQVFFIKNEYKAQPAVCAGDKKRDFIRQTDL